MLAKNICWVVEYEEARCAVLGGVLQRAEHRRRFAALGDVKTGAANDKTLLIVKDSYSNSLVPFLCSDYGTIIMVDLRYVNSSIYDYLPEGTMPDDVIIAYNEEKFMQDTHQMYLK